MQYTIAATALFTASALAAAIPDEINQNFDLGEFHTTCDLTNYPAVTSGPIGDAIDYLQHHITNDDKHSGCIQPGGNLRLTCSYGTSVTWFNTGSSQQCIDFKDAGNALYNAYNGNGQIGCKGSQERDENDEISAFQIWGTDWNILARGTGAGVSCSG